MLITALIIVSEAKALEYEWVKIEKKSRPSMSLSHDRDFFFFFPEIVLGKCVFVCVCCMGVF